MPKIITAQEAAEMVNPGDKILFGGFLAVGAAENLVDALVEKNVKHLSLFCSVFVFAFSFFMYNNFDPAIEGFQFVEKVDWFSSIGINYHLGIDGISIFFVLLSVFLTPICILASWNSIKKRVK